MIRVLHSVSVMDRGGQETLIMNVYRNIDRTKVQFDFLCYLNKVGDYDDEIKALGGKIIYLDIERKGGKFSKYYYEVKNISRFLSNIAADYDVIHLHNYHAFSSYLSVLECKKAGFKNIILHSHNSLAPRIKLHKIFRPLLQNEKGIVRYACSQNAGKWLHGNQKFDIIYNGIDVEKFNYDETARNELRAKLGLNDNYVIGMVGRFNYQKNHLFALDVFAECVKNDPKTRLVLVGKGELENEIKRKIDELDLKDKVLILGTRDDVNKLMSVFDVLFLPSIFEGLGIVLIEAQYCSLPCVASDIIVAEAKISDILECVNLNYGKEVFVSALLRKRDIDRNKKYVTSDIFDIRNVAKDLEDRYEKLS